MENNISSYGDLNLSNDILIHDKLMFAVFIASKIKLVAN